MGPGREGDLEVHPGSVVHIPLSALASSAAVVLPFPDDSMLEEHPPNPRSLVVTVLVRVKLGCERRCGAVPLHQHQETPKHDVGKKPCLIVGVSAQMGNVIECCSRDAWDA